MIIRTKCLQCQRSTTEPLVPHKTKTGSRLICVRCREAYRARPKAAA